MVQNLDEMCIFFSNFSKISSIWRVRKHILRVQNTTECCIQQRFVEVYKALEWSGNALVCWKHVLKNHFAEGNLVNSEMICFFRKNRGPRDRAFGDRSEFQLSLRCAQRGFLSLHLVVLFESESAPSFARSRLNFYLRGSAGEAWDGARRRIVPRDSCEILRSRLIDMKLKLGTHLDRQAI